MFNRGSKNLQAAYKIYAQSLQQIKHKYITENVRNSKTAVENLQTTCTRSQGIISHIKYYSENSRNNVYYKKTFQKLQNYFTKLPINTGFMSQLKCSPVVFYVNDKTETSHKQKPAKSYTKLLKKHFKNLLSNRNKLRYTTAAVISGAPTEIVIEPIPEPPPVPDVDPLNPLNALGEPTFESIGLGGFTPVGIVQNCLEYLHVTLGVPWWEVVLIGTIVIRTVMFPLVIISQRNAAKMNNCLPQMQAIQLKMTEARQMGNQLDTARYSQELMHFMKEKGVNPFKNMIVPLAQAPVFVSFFIGLRQMANTPVESLKTGGLFWFEDLTVPDQYFALPVFTSLTLWATIELGTDSAKLNASNMHIMKYVLRAMPLVVFPFTINFPGIILCYWGCSNFISLLQVGFLKIPSVRDFFKIEPTVTHRPENLPMKPKGFTEGIRDSWTNIKITKELEERQRLDEIRFQRAGRGPVAKTYKYDPTKQLNPNAVSAKKR